MRNLLLLLFFSISYFASAQQDSIQKPKEYSFVIQDSPSQLFTMRQMNQTYLSGSRLLARALYTSCKSEHTADLIQVGLQALILMPLTHEEGHRSILTGNNIGSISQPYMNKYGAAYVKGVTDKTLKDLRDNDLPTYIRIHTGGLESDYMLTKRVEEIGSFEQDDYRNYKWEYWVRKFAILQYYVSGLFKFDIDLKEEKNELERDIVGYDTYGAIRHLHRPTMEFYRYTKYSDLTKEEKNDVKKAGYLSLLNIVNPMMFGKQNFKLNENTRLNCGLGYTMAPFGDFIDENIWIKYKAINIGVYARQFQNRSSLFNAFGLSLNEFHLIEKVSISMAGHFWQQPNNFDFNTSDYFTGGAIDGDLRYFFMSKRNNGIKGFSIDFGCIYKTKGFLPEELYINEHLGFRIGTTLIL
ncbi:MAG: hypothetical protein A2033_02610 [Bacteroidetes bacterium GWA2_31_9]|nr:MAG: hypothetical protein A2033_02610 [Bacteroidetes bacterium GWA2_31_9]